MPGKKEEGSKETTHFNLYGHAPAKNPRPGTRNLQLRQTAPWASQLYIQFVRSLPGSREEDFLKVTMHLYHMIHIATP